MKNFVFTLLFLVLFGFSSLAQTKFETGFKAGFESGYCYSPNNSNHSFPICVPPLAPLPPLPQINERSESFQDGYNRGFLYGQARRRAEENKSSNERSKGSETLKFSPYIPQNPIILLTPEERAAYYESRARQDQATSEAIAYLLEQIFTSSPEGKKRRADAKIKRAEEMLQEKADRQKIKDDKAKQFYEGSESYNRCKKSKNIWLASAFITGAAGTYSYLKANDFNSLYQNATSDAASIAKKGDLYYTIAPICFSAAGICAFEFLMKSKRINKAKTQPIVLYPQFMPEGAGLCLKFNF
jgi:hypothetical protein